MSGTARERHIEYAQARRDNETEAREELESRLPDFSPDLKRRGDLTQAAKIMVAALQYFAPSTEIAEPVSRRDFGGSRSKEYAKLRRDNEVEAREALAGVIPEEFRRDPDLDRNDFNQTTKVVMAAAKYFDSSNKDIRGGSSVDIPEEASDDMDVERQEDISPSAVDQTATTTPLEPPQTPQQAATNVSLVIEDNSSPLTYLPDSSLSTPPELSMKGQSEPTKQDKEFTTATEAALHLTARDKTFPDINVLQNLHKQFQEEDRELDLKPPAVSVFRAVRAPPIPVSTSSYGANIAAVNENYPLKRDHVSVDKQALASQFTPFPKSAGTPELQQLRQVTQRLVAKAEEVTLVNSGIDGGRDMQGLIAQASDLIIDMIAVLDQSADQREQKRIMDKWAGKKGQWETEGVEFQE